MSRTVIGIAATPERALVFEKALRTRDVLLDTVYAVDQPLDMAGTMKAWKDARVVAAVLDEAVIVGSPSFADKAARCESEAPPQSFPIIVVGQDVAPSDPTLLQAVERTAFGGVVRSSVEPSLQRALVSRLDAICTMKGIPVRTSAGNASSAEPAPERPPNRKKLFGKGGARKQGLFHRKKHAHAAQEELYRSLGGKNGSDEEGAVESFFASTPTPWFPESDDAKDEDAARAPVTTPVGDRAEDEANPSPPDDPQPLVMESASPGTSAATATEPPSPPAPSAEDALRKLDSLLDKLELIKRLR